MIDEIEEKASGCPYHSSHQITGDHISVPEEVIVQDEKGEWHIYGYELARSVLRGNHTSQAGFQAELMDSTSLAKKPMLFLEGSEHHNLRKNTAKYFTPKSVKNYDGMIESYVEELLGDLRINKEVDLSELSLKLATRVAAKVIGLTNSNINGLTRRVSWFFEQEVISAEDKYSFQNLKSFILAQIATLRFFFADVRPAIKFREEAPQDDLISHLLEKEYAKLEILTECLMFGAAGMVTTREFISVAAWHFLNNEKLKDDYLAADHITRHEILHEVLRLEPVVGILHRRATESISIEENGKTIHILAGDLIHLHIYGANADESVFGAATDIVCPHRELPKSIHPPGMSFGDGAHRCPGAYIAIEESDIFLTRLLQIDGLRIKQEPSIKRNKLVEGYEIRNFILTAD